MDCIVDGSELEDNVGGVIGNTIILVKLLHPSNADKSMEVTLSGIITLVKLPQRENARVPIEVTPSGIVKEVAVFPIAY